MKKKEGQLLEKKIQSHLRDFLQLVVKIEKRAPLVREAAQKKLTATLRSLLEQEGALDERLVQAALSFSDRSDITEELARLQAHCSQFKTIKEGRTLDFLVQEMGREINTIGAKAADLANSHSVVAGKSALEKIKEQLQNIE
jgi:uncharacterized protein (TIGR00255 family)